MFGKRKSSSRSQEAFDAGAHWAAVAISVPFVTGQSGVEFVEDCILSWQKDVPSATATYILNKRLGA